MTLKRYILICAWGDLFLHLWQSKHGPKPSGWYVFSAFPDMERFLRAQPDITEVKHLLIDKQVGDYGPSLHYNWNNLNASRQASVLANRMGLPKGLEIEIPGYSLRNPCTPWHGAHLPKEESNWAKSCIKQVKKNHPNKKLILVHPYSFNHLTLARHWPYIEQAWNWLLTNTEDILILTGKSSPLRPNLAIPQDRVIDLTDQLPNVIHLFALANECDIILTTSNCLSCWVTNQNLSGLVWLDCECMSAMLFSSWHTYSNHVHWDESLDQFIEKYKGLRYGSAFS